MTIDVRLDHTTPLPTLIHLAAWVHETLGDEFPADTNGIWWEGDGRPLTTLGVALQGSKRTAERAIETGVDAVLLHRPWGLGYVPESIGVIAVHEALDERLTTAENPWLAQALGFDLSEKIRTANRRPLLTLATVAVPMPAATLMHRLRTYFPPLECWNPAAPDMLVKTIAFATAMRPALLAIAAECGASLYLTGTLKDKILPFLEQSHLTAIGVGQTAAEQWGMVWLASQLHNTFGVEIVWLDEETPS